MAGFFNFYDPLERRYIFNSFLVVVALVEVLILAVTLIWQIDEGWLGGPVREVPFPWTEYLLVSFAAPIALIFLFGVIVRGFESSVPPAGEQEPGPNGGRRPRRFKRLAYFWAAGGLLLLLLVFFQGSALVAAVPNALKALGLGGTYLLVAVVALGCLYFPLRLLLNYRLQKKALEYQYLAYLAERHGLVLTDPKKPGVSLDPAGRPALLEAPAEPPEHPAAGRESTERKN